MIVKWGAKPLHEEANRHDLLRSRGLKRHEKTETVNTKWTGQHCPAFVFAVHVFVLRFMPWKLITD